MVYEKPGSACAIIGSVLDYDPKSGRTRHHSADQVIAFVKAQQLQVAWILKPMPMPTTCLPRNT